MKPLHLHIVYSLIVGAFCITTPACIKDTETNFSIEGEIKNLPETYLLALKEISLDSISIDTIALKSNGKFRYQGTVNHPTLVSLSLGGESKPLTIYLDKNYEVTITGDLVEPYSIESKGGVVNDELDKFRANNIQLLETKFNLLSRKDSVDLVKIRNINLQLAKKVSEGIQTDPSKISNVILMNTYYMDNVSDDILGNDISLLRGAAANFFLTDYLKNYYEKTKKLGEGSPAPNIGLKNANGKFVNLKDFEGKHVLLIFDSKASLSSNFEDLKEVQKQLKDSIKFVSVIIDENEFKLDTKTKEVSNVRDWTVLIENRKWGSPEVEKYNVRTTPYMVLISPQGFIAKHDVTLNFLQTYFQ
ncbi:MAG: hypothetical protein RL662_1936 [Bacteroidota bacterium]